MHVEHACSFIHSTMVRPVNNLQPNQIETIFGSNIDTTKQGKSSISKCSAPSYSEYQSSLAKEGSSAQGGWAVRDCRLQSGSLVLNACLKKACAPAARSSKTIKTIEEKQQQKQTRLLEISKSRTAADLH